MPPGRRATGGRTCRPASRDSRAHLGAVAAAVRTAGCARPMPPACERAKPPGASAPPPNCSRPSTGWRARSTKSAGCARACAPRPRPTCPALARHRPARAAARARHRPGGPARADPGRAGEARAGRKSPASGSIPRTPRWSRESLRQNSASAKVEVIADPRASWARWSSRRRAAIWMPRWNRSFRKSNAVWPTACGGNHDEASHLRPISPKWTASRRCAGPAR